MDSAERITLIEPGKAPRAVLPVFLLSAGVNVYLKGRATDYEAFHFKAMGMQYLNCEWYYDGRDDEHINLQIALKDIDYVTKGRK